MSMIHLKGAMMRGAALAAIAAGPLAALTPQTQQTGTTAPARAGGRGSAAARCLDCVDSTRAQREVLLVRLDSLRKEYFYRRLSQPEMEALARQMDSTMMQLRAAFEASAVRARLAPTPRAEGFGGAVAAASPGAQGYTITVQTIRRGYLGLTLDGPRLGWPTDAEQPEVVRYMQYPRVASVDAESPAERAGLLAGDTLLAMNGSDVVENRIPLAKILVPDEKVTLRVRRAGDAKEFRVVVGEAPPYVVRRITPAMPREAFVTTVAPSAQAGALPARTRSPQPTEAPATPPGYLFQGQGQGGRMFVFTAAVAGARIETITDGLDKLTGVKEGVLVMQVPPGTPAYASGLHVGDIIVSVAGNTVATARQLTNYVNNIDLENGVKLVILRDKKQQDLTLRWK